jgi:hypothetical protein
MSRCLPSVNFIPYKFIDAVRDCYIMLLEQIKSKTDPHLNSLVNAQSVHNPFLEWKKLFLLSNVLLTTYNKKILKKRIENIMKDDWSSFLVKDFIRNPDLQYNKISTNSDNQPHHIDERKKKKAHKLVSLGELSKAMNHILIDHNQLIDPSIDIIVGKLQTKFPPKAPSPDHQQITHLISQFEVQIGEVVQVEPTDLREII